MREIREVIFRGKRLHDNKWIYGNFISDCEGNPHIIEPRFFCEDGHHLQYEDNTDTPVFIIPETVGQFTGLTDKNGTKIFEGDILTIENEGVYAAIKYNESNAAFYVEDEDHEDYLGEAWETDVVIIGNIHDNPESLKGGGDNG